MVKKVFIEPDAGLASPTSRGLAKANSVHVVNEPAAAYNWTNPSRPATDEEIERMLEECEKGPSYTSEEVMDFVKTELKEWRKKKK